MPCAGRGSCRPRRERPVDARAQRPRAVRARPRIEQRRHGAVAQPLDDDDRRRDEIRRASAQSVGAERAQPAVGGGEPMLPGHLSVQPGVLLAGIRQIEREMMGHGIARALPRGRQPDLVGRGGRAHEIQKPGRQVRIDHARAVALEVRRARPGRRDHRANPVGQERSAEKQIHVRPRVEPCDRRRRCRGAAGVQRRRRSHEPDRAQPRRPRVTRRERHGHPWSADVDRHQAGGDVDAIPGVHSRNQQRRARAARVGDVGVTDVEDRLRPGAAVRADARRRRRAHATGVNAVGDHVRDGRVEQREQVGAGWQIPERIDGDRGAERRPLLGTRRLRAGMCRERDRDDRDDTRRAAAIESGHAGSHFKQRRLH